MRLIKKTSLVENIANEWVSQYGDSEQETKEKLEQLNPPTEDRITEIIGNNGWTETICGECNLDKPVLVHFGEEENIDIYSKNIQICTDCLQKGIQLTKDI